MKEEDFNPFFISALLDMNASLILQDLAGTYLCITGLPEPWRMIRGPVPSDEAIFGSSIAHLLKAAKRTAIENSSTEVIEVPLDDGKIFEFRLFAFSDRDGNRQVIITIIDRSDERRREKVLQSLLRDVSHRSKNLLAIIQSIVTQTSQYSDSIDGFVQKLRGRIFSLSRSQDLVTDSGWRGAYVEELLDQQVSAYIPSGQKLVNFSGDNILLSPNVTMHLGLAFHELLMNAINYGTFLSAGSEIAVSCRLNVSPGLREIVVEWKEPLEEKAPAQLAGNPQNRARLGTAILERVVPASVSGMAEYSRTQDEIRWALKFPAEMPKAA